MAALRNKVEQFIQIMNEVYSVRKSGDSKCWNPKAFDRVASRYLWTDAFGVCNYITLYKQTGDNAYLTQAVVLVNAVHTTLGKQRDGKSWLGNASEHHPTIGGLRIGKADPEGDHRGDHMKGDGQYYHYLTKWMFALNRLSVAARDTKYNHWAIELAQIIHNKFVYDCHSSRPHIYWKMRIDLSAPWVTAEGKDDPYDGFAIYKLLQQTAVQQGLPNSDTVLQTEIKVLEKIVMKEYKLFDSSDCLGLGCMLCVTNFFPDEDWACHITNVCKRRLEEQWTRGKFPGPLGFREFGAYIGIQVHDQVMNEEWADRIDRLQKYWMKRLYDRDKDITPVMYCTTLIPGVLSKQCLE